MQAFAYRHLVPSQELAVTVNGPARLFARDSFKILSVTPVKIPVGGTVRVRVSTPSGAFADRFQLALQDAPEGISLDSVSPEANSVELVFRCGSEKERLGSGGNLICGVLRKDDGKNSKKAGKAVNAVALPTLPAIPYQIVAE
jgi:hypothetical protein